MLAPIAEGLGGMLGGETGAEVGKFIGEGGPVGELIDSSPVNVATKEAADVANNTITGLGRDLAKAGVEKLEEAPVIGGAIKKMEHIGSSIVSGVEDKYHDAVGWLRNKFGLKTNPRNIKLDQLTNTEHNAANKLLRERINALPDDNPYKQQMLSHPMLKDMPANTSVEQALRDRKYLSSIDQHPTFEYSRPGYYRIMERTAENPAGAWKEYKINPSNSIDGKIADLNREMLKNDSLHSYVKDLRRGGHTIESRTHLGDRITEMLKNPPTTLTPQQQNLLKSYAEKFDKGRYNITDTEGFNANMPLKRQIQRMNELRDPPADLMTNPRTPDKLPSLSPSKFKGSFGITPAVGKTQIPQAFVEAIVHNPEMSLEEKEFLLKNLEKNRTVTDKIKELREAGGRIPNSPYYKPGDVSALEEERLNRFRNQPGGADLTPAEIEALEQEAELEAATPDIEPMEKLGRRWSDPDKQPITPPKPPPPVNPNIDVMDFTPPTSAKIAPPRNLDFDVPSTMFSDKYMETGVSSEKMFSNATITDRIKDKYTQLKESIFGIDYSGAPELISDELLENLSDWEAMDVMMDDVVEDLSDNEVSIAESDLPESKKMDKVAQLKKFFNSDMASEIGTYVGGGLAMGAGGAVLEKLSENADKIPSTNIKKISDAYKKFKELKEGYDMAKSIADELLKAYNNAPNNTARSRELKNKLDDMKKLTDDLNNQLPPAGRTVYETLKKASTDLSETRNQMRQVQAGDPQIPTRWKSNIMSDVSDEYGKYLSSDMPRRSMAPVMVKIYNNNQSPHSFNKRKQYKYRLGHKIPMSYIQN